MQLTIETPRLLLRPNTLNDWDIGIQVLSDPEVMRYVGAPLSPEDVRKHMPTFIRRSAGGAIGIWIAEHRATGEKIGDGILLPLPIEADDTEWELMGGDEMPDRDIEVGYLLKPSAWGHGYASEICAALIDFGFENTNLEEIVAVTDPDNGASRRVLIKCGLINHGMRRAYGGETTDFRISRAAWERNQS